jgi:hypothetical protein
MTVLLAWTLVLLLVGGALALHHRALALVSTELVPRLENDHPWRVELTVGALVLAHLVEIVFFGAGNLLAVEVLEIGSLAGHDGSFRTYVYYAAVSFTSLGLGDMYPVGEMRLLTGVQALTGLLLIGWSASYLFVEMRELWSREPVGCPSCGRPQAASSRLARGRRGGNGGREEPEGEEDPP